MTLTDKLFSFDGRLRRRDWWLLSLGLSVVSFVISDLARLQILGPGYSIFISGWSALLAAGTEPLVAWIGIWVSLGLAWPSFAMAAKRAHDRGKSARFVMAIMGWIWLWSVPQALLAPAMAGYGENPAFTIGFLIGYLVSLIATIYWFVVTAVLDGEPHDNRFGPSPKA